MTTTETITTETAVIQWETQLLTYATLLQTSHSPTVRHIGEDLQTIHQGLTTYRKNNERRKERIETPAPSYTPKTLLEMIQEQRAETNSAPALIKEPAPENPSKTNVPDPEEHQSKSPGRRHPKVNDNHPNHWTEEETSLLRTCTDGEQAIRNYRIYFGNRRNDNGIIQKYNKLRLAGKLLKKDDRVKLIDQQNIYAKQTGIIKKFNDERTHATVAFDTATILVEITNLEVIT